MADILFHAHSGLRYLVLLAGLIALSHGLLGSIRRRPFDRTGRVLGRVFLGVLDLQVLLGILTLLVRPYYPALAGHIAMMVFAALVAHAGSVIQRRRPEERRSHSLQLRWVALTLVLIAAGIMAIGRGVI